jgi:hypothetical protein
MPPRKQILTLVKVTRNYVYYESYGIDGRQLEMFHVHKSLLRYPWPEELEVSYRRGGGAMHLVSGVSR